MPNSVNRPSASGPTRMRRTASTITNRMDSSEMTMPANEKACSGTSENPVTRSKFRRIRLYREYFDSPAARSSCATVISTGLRAKV